MRALSEALGKSIAILAVFFGVSAASMTAATPPDAFAGLGAQLDEIRAKENLPALAVSVSRRGRIVYEQGFGWANKEQRIAATEHTIFSLASVSKPITTTGLMTLVRAGKVELDRPANDYLGNAKLKARVGDVTKATVRRLANHSAGLPLHFQYFFTDEPYAVPSRDETILRYGNLVTPPGEHYQYSNVGFGVLDTIISRVSGETFAKYMHQQVFAKLGMSHTSVGIDPALQSFVAVRYDDDGTPLVRYQTDTPGSSEVYSSAHDLARFGMFHLKDHLADQKPILSDAELDEMHRPTIPEGNVPRAGYAIGWEVIDRPDGYRVVTHTGGMPGVATALVLLPREDIAVALVANGFRYDLNEALDRIMRTMLPNWTAVPTPPEQKNPPFKPTPFLVGDWNGRVHTDAGDSSIRVRILADGRVSMQIGERTPENVTDVAFKSGTLSGVTRGELNAPDLKRHAPYELELNLQARGNSLTGCVTAFRSEGRPFGLSHWAELRKQSQSISHNGEPRE